MTSFSGITTPTGSVNLTDAVYGAGVWVAVESGTSVAYTSTDGINWIPRSMPSSASWASVTYGNGVFVALAGFSEFVATSPDGITWTQGVIPAGNWTKVAFGNGLFFVIAVYSTTLLTSADGSTWAARTLPASVEWRSLAYGSGVWVIVAAAGSVFASSPDGINWTQRTPGGFGQWFSVAYGNGIFVALSLNASQTATSSDGITWTRNTSIAGLAGSTSWRSVAFGDSKFLAVGYNTNKLVESVDGVSWIEIALDSSGLYVSVDFGGGQFLILSEGSGSVRGYYGGGSEPPPTLAILAYLSAPSPLGFAAFLARQEAQMAIFAPSPLGSWALLVRQPIFSLLGVRSPLGLAAFLALQKPCVVIKMNSPLGLPKVLASHDFTAVLGDGITRWLVDLITPDGTVRVPISSWQATLQTAGSSYAQCVIPACEAWLEAISTATEFVIYRRADVPGAALFVEYEMVRGPAEQLQFDRGPTRYTCTLSGYPQAFAADLDPPVAYDRTLAGVRAVSQGSKLRVRCAVDWFLRPGQRAYLGALPFVVSYINYYALESDSYMDVGD